MDSFSKLYSFFVYFHAPEKRNKSIYAVKVTSANVRVKPSMDAKILTKLLKNQEVIVIDNTGIKKRWIRIRLIDNREGYIFSALIKEQP